MQEVLYIKSSPHSIEAIKTRLKEAAERQEFGLLNVTDLQAKLASKGQELHSPCLVFDICNPVRAKIVLENRMDISTVLPCRISVYEEGGETRIATLLPSKVLGLFGNQGLEAIALSVEHALKAIIDDAAGE